MRLPSHYHLFHGGKSRWLILQSCRTFHQTVLMVYWLACFPKSKVQGTGLYKEYHWRTVFFSLTVKGPKGNQQMLQQKIGSRVVSHGAGDRHIDGGVCVPFVSLLSRHTSMPFVGYRSRWSEFPGEHILPGALTHVFNESHFSPKPVENQLHFIMPAGPSCQ